jgi:hypothetical protein
MIRSGWWTVFLLLTACGSNGAAPGGYVNPFAGTCLEPLFACFQASGQATCTYNPTSGVRTLTYPNGARVTSASGGTQENRCFGPTGNYCFTMTRSADPTRHTYRGGSVQDVTVIDTGQGDTIEVRCPGQPPVSIPRPFRNPAEEDLSAWSPCTSG